ncbi:hypothetical protein A3Q56_05632 [Intoshia linei]|uniref:Uncharacterized protein n=1 Tax=Intoshia linei TaxID=1819745 RepID=A0A177AZ34_9BILA|nr:hypothetical protein A3Q56_05632 [Intoshia linei]
MYMKSLRKSYLLTNSKTIGFVDEKVFGVPISSDSDWTPNRCCNTCYAMLTKYSNNGRFITFSQPSQNPRITQRTVSYVWLLN